MRAPRNVIPRKRSRGFTAVELMVVVVIVAILGMIAMPAFNEMIERQRAKNAAVDLYVALTRARSEALKLNQNVTVAPVSSNWGLGWQITNASGTVLEAHEAVRGLTIGGPASVVYRSSGRVQGGGLFTITGDYASSTRYICLDLSGRPSINTTASC